MWIMANALQCTPSEWFDVNKVWVLAVCPFAIETLFNMGSKDSWADVIDELTIVVANSLGKPIFQVHYMGVSDQRLSKYMAE
eukprot:13184067-Alexandrium_andersonii.AAC.1